MKKIIFIIALVALTLGASAQSFVHKVTPQKIAGQEYAKLRSTDTIAANGQMALFLRGGAVASYTKLYYSTTEKKILPDNCVRAGIGIELAHYETMSGIAVNDYGFGLYFLTAKDMGSGTNFCSAAAGVSIYDIKQILNLDFLPEGLSVSPAIVYDFRGDIPAKERIGFIPALSITF